MPIQKCRENNKPGYRWGNSGKCYTYSSDNEAGRKKAKQKAYLQGAAIGEEMQEQIEDWLEGKEDQDLDDYWKEIIESSEVEEQKRPQDRPGGSNVGQYKGVKTFCGPSGGAPKGSFPVNTRKRAIAALAYARNAPNPSGIRKCVCRNWPTLPICQKKKEGITEIAVDDFIDNCFPKKSTSSWVYEHDK